MLSLSSIVLLLLLLLQGTIGIVERFDQKEKLTGHLFLLKLELQMSVSYYARVIIVKN